jgi:CRISPR type I-E-associated protein CasB/Cse2
MVVKEQISNSDQEEQKVKWKQLSSQERREEHKRFVKALQTALRKNRAYLASLRRACGKTTVEAPGVVPVFYRYLPKDLYYSINEEIYFLVATLFGYNEYRFTGSFGKTLQILNTKINSTGIEPKLIRLISSNFSVVNGYKPGGGTTSRYLANLIRLAASYSVGVDWVQLLNDLVYWTHPDRFVQKRWVKDYYYLLKSKKKNQNEYQ